jgi:hypothetical protein
LNEGFATHAKWVWSEHEDLGPVQENFDFVYSLVPPDDPFWSLRSAILGPSRYSTRPCYWRGGTTLHQLRLAIGDDDFFRLVRTWARSHTGGNGTTAQFIALAERISGQDLVALFQTWLYIADPAGIVRRPGLGSYGVGPTGTHPGGTPAAPRRQRRQRPSGWGSPTGCCGTEGDDAEHADTLRRRRRGAPVPRATRAATRAV